MRENKHREPTLYIVGNKERADEIRHIIEDEWGGYNGLKNDYIYDDAVYYINSHGSIACVSIESKPLGVAIANGWMKEYKLPERQQFKPFDKVLVRDSDDIWAASYFSHIEQNSDLPFCCGGQYYEQCLPYNEKTAKLIGTSDVWEGGEE